MPTTAGKTQYPSTEGKSLTVAHKYTTFVNPGGASGKEPACQYRRHIRSLGGKDPLEKGMATHSSILAWKIPWTEEPSRLQSTGLQRVGHN